MIKTLILSAMDNNINTEQISDIAKLIEEHGETIVILSVFLLLFVGLFAFVIKSNDKTNELIRKQQEMLLDTIVKSKNEMVTKPVEKNIVEVFIRLNESLKEHTKDLRDKLDADRVSLYVFHNGTVTSHGLPFCKVTCLNERIKRGSGIVSRLKEHNAIPIGMFDEAIAPLYNDGYVSTNDIKEISDIDSVIGAMFKEQNVTSVAAITLYDVDNNVLGILMAEHKRYLDEEELKENKKVLIEASKVISPILEYSDFQK